MLALEPPAQCVATECGETIEEGAPIVGGEDRPTERAHEAHLVDGRAIGARAAERRQVDIMASVVSTCRLDRPVR